MIACGVSSRMKPNQRQWARSRDYLAGAVASLGFPEELIVNRSVEVFKEFIGRKYQR